MAEPGNAVAGVEVAEAAGPQLPLGACGGHCANGLALQQTVDEQRGIATDHDTVAPN